MRKSSSLLLCSLLCALMLGLVGCVGSSNKGTADKSTADKNMADAIPTPIPAKSKFAKLSLGWSRARVHDVIGDPTDTRSYVTGKAFIPMYFGSDGARMEDLYKGEGRIIYSGGAGMGNQGFTVFKIIYDPTEDGYNE